MSNVGSAAGGYRVENPATGEIIERFDNATDEEVGQVLDAADKAFASWREKTIEERAAIVNKVADLFGERKQELAEIIAEEMGKPIAEGIEEAEFCEAIFNYYADNGPDFAKDEEIKTFSGGKAFIQRRPIGPLLGIMPWNFPYYQVARFAAPNLVLGNTIILKHAEICPRSARAIADIMKEAGIPEGVYNNIFATHEQIETIIADPRVQGVSLTGSERAGSAVAAQAGKHLKKCVLELGGSDPYIVLDTENLEEAVETAWGTRMYNTGQACNSNKRMIVMEDIYDDFVAGLTKRAQEAKPGKPEEAGEGVYAPLSSRGAAEGLRKQLERAVEQGAHLVGGELADDGTAYLSPAVLTGVTSEMDAYREELFGPVATVYKVSSEDEALKLANDTTFGLGGAVFSTDKARAEKLAQQLEVGMSNVNTPAGEGAEIPFGGTKRSGFGRELGPYGMDEFVNKRMYYIAD
ncbi:succinate-semialdehyde dehydrogenase/glutarate-semialdehyde dehydrogenase [Brevibacterium sanguinis]|uniref:Succinate-semialdehyde dehydrogenase/glutarate-semialdehyde dehydrogenase n=2 Tax=Brevibacterium TaxID=1696 RepID=A0A366IHQ8_9MICO|nr:MULTISPECIES: NAD-dependent succinate-semialdehyde dehydrogenase [Brevibacterium]RBP65088.1 succinate-semialdehyde dehydrogenase/glutarate-semialdehyde dehydrogenase [Brevibacterium sanguinis]RBP71351.1 succinate-semialdehyde dehydrogenase/glutarate-semialdehyde dehydrogenase [Brevibacterium celere]